MNKKISSVLTAAALAAAIMPAAANAETGVKTGDYIRLGTYNGTPLIWRCAGEDENGALMFAGSVICYKAFDAASEGNSFGTNLWQRSAIRAWLNSPDENVVYTAALTSEENVWLGYNSYDKEPGFLTNFSEAEKKAVKPVRLKTPLNEEYAAEADGTYTGTELDTEFTAQSADMAYQYTTDSMFLLDTEQLSMVMTALPGYQIPENEAVFGGVYAGLDSSMKNEYWLRCPNINKGDKDRVYSVQVSEDEAFCSKHTIAYMSAGIRPGFYLNDNVSFVSGSGTADDPFIVTSDTVDNPLPNEQEKIIRVTNDGERIQVFLDKSELEFTDAKPFIDENDRTMIPIRAVAEGLNCGVEYDEQTRTVTVTDNDNVLTLVIGGRNLVRNGETIEMDTAAVIYGGRTYIPLRFAAEALGYDVNYGARVVSVTIDENGNAVWTTEDGISGSFEELQAMH